MSLFDYENEDAVEVLADMFEPAAVICADQILQAMVKNNKPPIMIATHILKNYPKQIVAIFAASEHTPVSEYHITIPKMIQKLLALVNDKEMKSFFTSQAQMAEPMHSGEPTENTEGKEQ